MPSPLKVGGDKADLGVSRTTLLLVDFIPLRFDGGERLARPALRAARAAAALKQQLRRRGVQTVYANDNYGIWHSKLWVPRRTSRACSASTPAPRARPARGGVAGAATGGAGALMAIRWTGLGDRRMLVWPPVPYCGLTMTHALIVEDDAAAADTLAALVANEQFTVATANTLDAARRAIAAQPPDIVLVDLHLPDGSGFELFDDPELTTRSEVVLLAGHPTVETSIQALRLGATDYLSKPVNVKHLQSILARYRKPASIGDEVAAMSAECDRSGRFGLMWGRSPAMRRIYQQLSRVAPSSVTVLIAGESGTGKELAARTVHDLSRRREKPFLALNCGAIAPNLIESEIFGHEKGSFTGADRQRIGYFERADGGSLFLDEITEMPLDLQVKLLRVLENGTFRRVGSTDDLAADVRIIAATNRVPEQAVTQGKLREDLLYRLNVFPITMPPLHARGDDVVLIATQFIDELIRREGGPKRLSPEALRRLANYRWPGNVRELRNAIQRAYLMTTEPLISDEWLPTDDMLAAPHQARNTAVTIPLGSSLAEAERTLILATLRHLDYHKDRTAAVLGVSRKTLYNRLQEYASDSLGGADNIADDAENEPA